MRPSEANQSPSRQVQRTTSDGDGTAACGAGLVLSAVVLLALGAARLHADGPGLPTYLDTDTYSRMVRVRELWAGDGWYASRFDRVVPDGLVSHWTRPLDALIILCALPFLPFLEPATALHWGGYIVSPLLCLVAGAIMACSLRPLLSNHQVAVTALALVCIFPVLAAFLPGRPDHYPPLIVVAALILAGLVRVFTRPDRAGGALLLGCALPLAIWVNINGVLLALAVPVILGLCWLIHGGDWARRNRTMVLTAMAVSAVALALERPPGAAVLAVEFDRLSIVHVVIFATVSAFWTTVVAIERRRPTWSSGPIRRLPWATGLSAIGIAVLLAVFPALLDSGSGIPIDPLYAETRLARITEYQPLITSGDLDSVAGLVLALASQSLFSLPFLIGAAGLLALLLRRRCVPGERWVWLALSMLVLTYLVATWPPTPARMTLVLALMAPGYGALGGALLAAPRRWRAALRIPTRAVTALLIIAAPIGVSSLVPSEASPKRRLIIDLCNSTALSRHLADALPASSRLNIMAPADLGPELMYTTPHAVYAIPNHRMQPGYTMTWQVMTAGSLDQARRELAEAEADILVLCGADGVDPFGHDDPPPDFRTRVLAGEVPMWLTPLELPEPLARSVSVYRVAPVRDEPAEAPAAME